MRDGERYEYAGFHYVLTRVGGGWQMIPMDNQPMDAYDSGNAIAALNQYVRNKSAASFCWANFCKMVVYGAPGWPSNSEWIVPGTVTDEERV